MLVLFLLFAGLRYFTRLYIVRNDENKDVQSIIMPILMNNCQKPQTRSFS